MNSPTFIHKNIKYFGTRPKNDESNVCRELLAEIVADFGGFQEICAERLYFIHLADNKQPAEFYKNIETQEKCPFIFWFFEEDNYFLYENFNMDFGPYNLAVTHLFCSRLKIWLDTQHHREPDKYIAIVIDNSDAERKLNVKLLVAIAALVLLNMSDQEVMEKLNFFMMHKGKLGETKKELLFKDLTKFSDVSGTKSFVSVTLRDCIEGFYAAMKLKWYNFYEFDHAEYLFYETVQSGDINWIVPNKLLAFAGPEEQTTESPFYNKHSPSFYYHYFKHYNVSTIVRLNKPEYSSSGFTDVGFEHHDLIFPDGYPPSSTIAAKFFKIVDQAKGAVAVHCFAGIGRTGTLIAAYIMAKYNFTSQMAIAWTRICRPGSVIGDQQDWLSLAFDPYSLCKTPVKTPVKNKKSKSQTSTFTDNRIKSSGDEPKAINEIVAPTQSQSTTYEIAEKTYGQATALMMAKKKRERPDVAKPCTRNVSNIIKRAAIADAEHEAAVIARKRSEFVIDLGKTLPCDVIPELTKDEYYHIKDHQYEWKVKLPNPSYITLRYNDSEAQRPQALEDGFERVFRGIPGAPIFRYEPDGESVVDTVHGKVKIPKKKPIVLYY